MKSHLIFPAALLLLSLFFQFQNANAAHIVGGDIYYDCLGNNNYRITLNVYRDCFSTGAPFDDPAAVAVFESASGAVVHNLFLPFTGSNTIPPETNNPCLQAPPNICVEGTSYQTVINLPPIAGGYDVVYQRCCRNNTIINIQNPGNTGATYVAHIPGPNVTPCNSSPRFTQFPPIVICANSPLVFDHSATDPDGDVLVYSLCTPFDGATAANPAPSTPGFYGPLQWSNPFNNNYQIVATPPLAIDPNTGLLTGTPTALGQFVVGICVSEYRNGVLIGETRRDFQFNVVSCLTFVQARVPVVDTTGSAATGTAGLYQTLCNNFTVNFTNTSINAATYFWDFGVPGTNADTSILANPSFTFPDTGTYIVTHIINKSYPCADTTRVIVKIYPTFTTDFNSSDVCFGNPIAFSDASVSTHGAVNSWNWTFAPGQTSQAANPSHTYNNPGTYQVTLNSTDTRGCSDTRTKTVTVFPIPNASFLTGPTCINQPINFQSNSTISSGSITNWNWNFDGQGTSQANNPTFTFSNTGVFPVTLIVTSGQGCSDTITQNITVNPLPVVTLTNDTTICPLTPFQLLAQGGVAYQWSPAAVLSNPSIPNPFVTILNPTTVSVTVTDANGCENSDSLNLDIHPLPLAFAGVDTFVCLGDSVRLNASGGASYTWTPSTTLSNSNVANPWAFPTDTTLYIVLVTDSNSCTNRDTVLVDVHNPVINPVVPDFANICLGDAVSIYAAGGTNYSWTPTVGIDNPSAQAPVFSPTDTTVYYVTVSNYCFSGMDTVTVNVLPLPDVDAGPDENLCLGDSRQLNGTGNGISWQWSPPDFLDNPNIQNPISTPTQTITYYLTTANGFGCINTDSMTITVFPPPMANAGPNRIICMGDTIQLNASGGLHYAWSPSTGLSNANIPDPLAYPSDTTVYYVTVSNIPGCERTDSVRISVQQPINPTYAADTFVCSGEFVRLFAGGGLYYQWSPSTYLNDPGIFNPISRPTQPIVYSVNIANDCFDTTVSIVVNVQPLPNVDAGEDVTIFRDEKIQLNATGAETYFWTPYQFADRPDLPNPVMEPFNTTTFIVEGTDAFGCRAYDSVTVYVVANTVLLLPTAFSPNGDGVNDVFRIVKYLNIDALFYFRVFNRWGEMIFETSDLRKGWDGTYKDVPQGTGTFVWQISARDKEGNVVQRSGNVTLVR